MIYYELFTDLQSNLMVCEMPHPNWAHVATTAQTISLQEECAQQWDVYIGWMRIDNFAVTIAVLMFPKFLEGAKTF